MKHVSDQHRRQRLKNFALIGVLMAMVVLFYLITIAKMGGGTG